MPGIRKKKETKPRPKVKQDGNGRAVVRLSKNTADIINNPELLSEWEDEELLRGQRKDKNGRFTGAPPRYIPSDVHNELVKRQLEVAKHKLAGNLVSAVETLAEIAKDKKADDHARIKAAGMIMERILGKPKETVKIEGDEPAWMRTLRVSIVSEDQTIIEGHVVGEGDKLPSV